MAIIECIPKFDPEHPASAVENMMNLASNALVKGANLLAFIHDDVEIHDQDWKEQIEDFFAAHPECGMVGFGGALGLGTRDLYKRPYDYKQLARIHFISNLTDAEEHGHRSTAPYKVVVLDGFSQIISRVAYKDVGGWYAVKKLGITFHMYDAAMACLLAEKGWSVWMLPISCTHHGGRTSCSKEYDQWLHSQGINGDQEVHEKAHRIIYDRFRNILPLRR